MTDMKSCSLCWWCRSSTVLCFVLLACFLAQDTQQAERWADNRTHRPHVSLLGPADRTLRVREGRKLLRQRTQGFSMRYTNTGKAYMPRQDPPEACDTRTCPRKKVCRQRNGRTRCTCKVPCTPVLRGVGPVCGTNNRTYRTLCLLRRANCRAGQTTDIFFQYPGNCNGSLEQVFPSTKPWIISNELPRNSYKQPRKGSLEHAVFTAPMRARLDLIKKLLHLRIKQYRLRNRQHR